MAQWQGFSERLQTPTDLLVKLRHDFERVKHNPTDSFAVFDFFVTAEHLVDWTWPSDQGMRTQARSTDPLATVSHLASGAKHFAATHPKHTSVQDVRTRSGAFQAGAFQADAFDVGGLVVETTAGTDVDALTLAAQVLKHWEAELASTASSP
jgi:hypothetical protein